MRNVKLALVQFESKMMDVKFNVEKGLDFVKNASQQGADIVVFPELFTTGYNPNIIQKKYYDLAETLDGPTVSAFRETAEKFSVNIILPIVLQKQMPGIIYNSAVVIGREGEILGYYSKTHLWAGERFYFKAGDEYPVFNMDFGKVGIMICYDGGFPEVSRILALKGAELILCPSAFPIWDKDMWDIYFKSRALENACFVAGINRVGKEESLHMFGNNKIANPRGKILMESDLDVEQMQVFQIDLDEVLEYRKDVPYLKDRRIHTYRPLCEIF
ncbi:MAG: beta-ureidopropionase [Thermoanaerobacteraceae bacterium]|jgi:predicted amidohydrolase|nr:beta-ureidopropionase [Thermoanaerobacteraceae bacterium]MDN5300801.1 beta-ureidopropionase [Thermoanaerobacteraceae bacterium]